AEEAVPIAERALATVEARPVIEIRALAELRLAQALWASGRDRPRALALARAAHDRLAPTQLKHDLAEVDARRASIERGSVEPPGVEPPPSAHQASARLRR